MRTTFYTSSSSLWFFVLVIALLSEAIISASAQQGVDIQKATLEESNQVTPNISTEELKKSIAAGKEVVLDVRSALEYAIAHIPGSSNVFEKEIEVITRQYPDRSTPLVLYCNGPYCGKSRRVSQQLANLGYTGVCRYQLGLPVWRALGNTAQTNLEGFRYVYTGDKTAVFVDARGRTQYEKETLPGAKNIQKGEAEKANEDGRLPLHDKGTRVIVFANSADEARTVAEEIARKAYWNSSYFGGSFEDLRRAGLWK